jgi:hypothetical protein
LRINPAPAKLAWIDPDKIVSMSLLPNWDRAILDLRKLEQYCLDPGHPRGRHKARVFRNSLGITRGDAAWLRAELLSGLRENAAIQMAADAFGARWRVDISITRQIRTNVVRIVWIQESENDSPRFLTCWVL